MSETVPGVAPVSLVKSPRERQADPQPDPQPGPTPEPQPGPRPGPPPVWHRWVDLGVRVLGFVVALLLTGLTAVFEVLYSSLFWDGYRVPVSIVAAVVVNAGLIWFTVAVTGRRIAVAAVAVLWVAVMVVASSRKSEGDLLLTDTNWVGIVTMLVGSLTYAVAGYRLVLTAFRPKL